MWKAALRLALRLACVALFILLLLWCGPTVWLALSPFIIALLVARLLQRPINFLQRRLRGKRFPATLICVLLCYIILGALLFFLLRAVVLQLIQAAGDYQHLLGDLMATVELTAEWFIGLLEGIGPALQDSLTNALNSVFAWLTDVVSRGASAVLNFTVQFAANIPMALIYVNFLLFGTYFIAKGYPVLTERAGAGVHWEQREQLQLTVNILKKGFFGYLRVQGIYALMVLVISGAALTLYGMPYAILITLVLALLEFLPLFGNGTLLIPWGIICFIIGQPEKGIFLLVLHVVQIGLRRVTEPKLMSGQMGLSPLLSLIGMYAGMRLYGVMGLILGPIFMLVLQNLYRARVFSGIGKDIRVLAAGLRTTLRDSEK